MKIEIILEIISGVCLLLGCILYLIHTEREDDKKFGILSIIITTIGIGLFIGVTNIPHSSESNGEIYYQPEDNEEEEIFNYNNEEELDP